MPKKEFDNLMKKTGGDLREVEKKLGLDKGSLGDSDTGIYYIPPSELKGIKIPSGNEDGVNAQWIPGGKTSGGVSEGVIYLKNPKIKYEEVNIKGLLND